MLDHAMTLPAYVPPELARLPNWVFWQHEVTTTGKITKVPYQVENWKRLAASTRPEEWATYDQAYLNYPFSDRAGVGFVFAEGVNIFGIDLDDLDKVAEADQEAAMRLRIMIREHFPTYREVSPSGKGCHYIGFGSLPPEIRSIKDSKYGIEVYDKERFFTFTGNVIDGMNQLANCQDALTDLAHTMRGAAVAARATIHNENDPRPVETIVASVIGWVNGDEFRRLMHDPLQVTLSRYKNDHSAADLALTNFIATATKDVNKAVDIFRASPLWREGGKGGYKPEQKYIDDYLVRICFGKVWGERALKEQQAAVMTSEGERLGNELIAAAQAQAEREAPKGEPTLEPVKQIVEAGSFARQYRVNLPYLDVSDGTAHYPPGMAGAFVKSIAEACATPVPEFAIAVGMAFLSGVVGRAYRYKGQGLNSFFMVGAKSATGKTQHIMAVQKLLGGMANPQMADRFYAVSGKTVQGLQTYFERYPAGAWITDECGSQIKALTEPQGQGDYELKDAINSLFDAAVPGKKWSPPASRTSQKEAKTITCLSVGIGWFTTREKIYRAINNDEVADGFLSRFTPIFYNGTMGADNHNIRDELPEQVAKLLATLWAIILENDMHMPLDGVANNSKAVKVAATQEATDAFFTFGQETRNLTRRAQAENDDLPDAFVAIGRVNITAQRLAGVCAVMDNPVAPVITIEHAKWAIQFVGSRMLHVLELIATGEVGSDDSIEVPTIVRVVKRLLVKHGAKVPSWALHDKLRLVLPFKAARIGAMNAVKQALNQMIDDGRLHRATDNDGHQGRPMVYYTITNDAVWKKY